MRPVPSFYCQRAPALMEQESAPEVGIDDGVEMFGVTFPAAAVLAAYPHAGHRQGCRRALRARLGNGGLMVSRPGGMMIAPPPSERTRWGRGRPTGGRRR